MRRFLYQRRSSGIVGARTRGLWFTYRGRPLYPLGTDGDFLYGAQAPQRGTTLDEFLGTWRSFFDSVAEYGVNLVRFSPWWFCWESAAPEWAVPFAPATTAAPGQHLRYDLQRPNPVFFDMLAALCREAQRRDILVLLVLWDDCSLSPGGVEGGPWMRHPVSALCGGPCTSPGDFYDLRLDANISLQQELAARICAAVRDCPNVLLDICNEVGASLPGRTGTVRDWLVQQLLWARREAPNHLLGVSGSSWSVDGGSAEEFWAERNLDFLLPHESDGRHALHREETSRQFLFYSRQGIDKPRIVGDVCFSGAGGMDDVRRHLWVSLANGGHALNARPSGFPYARVWDACRIVGDFLRGSGIPWWTMNPVPNPLSPDPGLTYTLGDANNGQFLTYFLERPFTPVRLDLPGHVGDVALRWIDTERGRILRQARCHTGETLAFPPGRGDIGLWISAPPGGSYALD